MPSAVEASILGRIGTKMRLLMVALLLVLPSPAAAFAVPPFEMPEAFRLHKDNEARKAQWPERAAMAPPLRARDAADRNRGGVVVIVTTTVTELETRTVMPPPTTTGSTAGRSCDLLYCDAGTSYCEYWGGYSSFDVSEGRPIPGETRTALGTCAYVAPTSATTTGDPSSSSSSSSSRRSSSSICTTSS